MCFSIGVQLTLLRKKQFREELLKLSLEGHNLAFECELASAHSGGLEKGTTSLFCELIHV